MHVYNEWLARQEHECVEERNTNLVSYLGLALAHWPQQDQRPCLSSGRMTGTTGWKQVGNVWCNSCKNSSGQSLGFRVQALSMGPVPVGMIVGIALQEAEVHQQCMATITGMTIKIRTAVVCECQV